MNAKEITFKVEELMREICHEMLPSILERIKKETKEKFPQAKLLRPKSGLAYSIYSGTRVSAFREDDAYFYVSQMAVPLFIIEVVERESSK